MLVDVDESQTTPAVPNPEHVMFPVPNAIDLVFVFVELKPVVQVNT
jgi:hypothetical protein